MILSPDLVYEISIFLSPKDLIRLSLCSKHLRRAILSDQSIWRIQYYREWPAILTPHDSNEEALFPAPTWIQTFIMRKLSELNMERQQSRETTCDTVYQFTQNLQTHYDFEQEKLAVYKNMSEKVAEYDSMPKNYKRYDDLGDRVCCEKDRFVYFSRSLSRLYCFSLSGGYTYTENILAYRFFFIDSTHLIGLNSKAVYFYKIGSENKIQLQGTDNLMDHVIAQVDKKSGYFVSAEVVGVDRDSVNWYLWDFRHSQAKLLLQRSFSIEPESVIRKEFYQHCEGITIGSFLLANADFVFIPFMTEYIVFLYIYSIKEDRSRIVEMTEIEIGLYLLVFYDSVWNGVDSYLFCEDPELMCIHVSGNSLDTFECRVCSHEYDVIKFIQISRRLLLVVSHTVYKLFNTESGTRVWEIHHGEDIENFDCSSRYLMFNSALYDFSPEKVPETKDWLYILFE